jgi:hypothetical protein
MDRFGVFSEFSNRELMDELVEHGELGLHPTF